MGIIVIRGGLFRIQHEINALNLQIICDTTLTLVDTSGSVDKLRVSVPSIRLGLRISTTHHTENYCTVLCCTLVQLVLLCITVDYFLEVSYNFKFAFYWCNQPCITGMQPTQPYRHGTCCFASVTMPHTLYYNEKLSLPFDTEAIFGSSAPVRF